MKKRLSNNPVSGSRVERSGIHSVNPADSFFRKPAGVFLICLLLFGLTVWVFVPALKTDFQYFDENGELLRNAHANTGLGWQNLRWALFSMEYSNWYPLTWISHMLDFRMFGSDPWGHHLTSVLLHAANAVLIFLVLKRMTGALWRSLIVAALFALHPLRVESVAWISERKDVLSAFFGLLALWTYARYAEESKMQGGRKKLFYGLTLLFFAFGLMSKTMLVTFPCILLLLDYWPLERWRLKSKRSLALEKVPFFLLVVPVSIAAYFAQKAGGQFMLHFPMSFRLETALMGYARYLGKMFWPANISVLYPYPNFWPVSQLLFAAALILGVSVLAFGLRRQRPYLLVGWLWYLGTLVPVIGLIPLGVQFMSNRYTYIPMIGIVLLTVWAVNDLSKQWRRRMVLVAAGVVLMMGVCISRTRGEIVYWKNGATLWGRAVAVTKDNFMAHYCLGTVLLKTDLDKAVSELKASVAIYPDYFDSELVLGSYLMSGGHYSDAVAPFERAAELQPRNSWAHHNLGLAFFQLNRMGDAIPQLLKAVEVDPQNAAYKNDLGFILFSGDRETDAISNFLATAVADPAGFTGFLDAMQFDTNYVAMINNMALSFATNPDPALRNGKYAVRLATRACEMSGFKSISFVETLAAAYAEDSRFDEAISTEQLACSLASAAGQTDALRNSQSLLESFRAHKPFHAGVEAIFHQPN
jgi:tetratricopeptide (TPR) repeat protein